jgi:hypothetical protein
MSCQAALEPAPAPRFSERASRTVERYGSQVRGNTSRILIGAGLACAVMVAVAAFLLRVPASSETPAPSRTPPPSAASATASATASGTAGPFVADCSTPAVRTAPPPTPAFSPRAHGAAPKGWPATIEHAQADGRVAPDGTAYFVDGDYLLAVDAAGKELPGWPQPLDFTADLNVQLAFASDGSVYVWGASDDTLDRFGRDGSRSPGFPFRRAAIADVVPMRQGVLVVSSTSGSVACGNVRGLATVLGDTGAASSTWTLRGEFLAVGPDGTIYSLERTPSADGSSVTDSIFAYDAAGAVEPGWPIAGYGGLTFDPDGRIYLWSWTFRPMPGISMEGPGLALRTAVTSVDAGGRVAAGWPKTFEGAASEPVFGPDGTVYLSLEIATATDSILAFAPDGTAKPGWPVSLPDGRTLLSTVPAVSAASPDPPEIGPDGTVTVATTGADSQNGSLVAFDPSGGTKPGSPVSVDWNTISNVFFAMGPGAGWYAIGATGIVYLTDDYAVRAIGPDGRAAPGWPIQVPDGMVITSLQLEPDGGLLVEALLGGQADTGGLGPLAFAGGAGAIPLAPDHALSVDFPGRLYAIRYLPGGAPAR